MTIRIRARWVIAIPSLMLLAFATAAGAQDRVAFTATFMDGCLAAGNEQADCACIVENWSADLSDADLPIATAAVEMSFLEKMPDMNTVNQVMPMIMGMTDYSLRCASGELTASGDTDRTEIPQTGDATEEALLLERLTSGEATLSEMVRYDQLVMDRRDAERAAEQEAQQEKQARAAEMRDALAARYEAELARIHSRPIPDWAVSDFETLFTLYCQMGGNSDAACSCGWDQVTDLARNNNLPYLASRSEGDDVLDHISQGALAGTFPALRLLGERRAVCDGL